MKYIQTAAFGVSEYEVGSQPRRGRPRISPAHYRRLRRRGQATGKTITQLVAEALDDYFANLERGRRKVKPREVKITLRVITIKDAGEEFTVRTLRTAQDIAAYVERSEKAEMVNQLERAVSEAYEK